VRPACVRLTVWGIDDGHSWVNIDPEFDQIPDAPSCSIAATGQNQLTALD